MRAGREVRKGSGKGNKSRGMVRGNRTKRVGRARRERWGRIGESKCNRWYKMVKGMLESSVLPTKYSKFSTHISFY